MPRPRRQTNIQLLNRAFDNIVKLEDSERKPPDTSMSGTGASREVKPKKKLEVKKKKEHQPINTRILLTR